MSENRWIEYAKQQIDEQNPITAADVRQMNDEAGLTADMLEISDLLKEYGQVPVLDTLRRLKKVEVELSKLRAANEWQIISKDGLPKKEDDYLCLLVQRNFTKDTSQQVVSFYFDGWDSQILWDYEVIAYRELPEPTEVNSEN